MILPIFVFFYENKQIILQSFVQRNILLKDKQFHDTYNDTLNYSSAQCMWYKHNVGKTFNALTILEKYLMCERHAGYVMTVLMINFDTYF